MSTSEQIYFGQDQDFLTVRHLKIRGSNFEIGHQLGKLAVERYGKKLSDFVADPLFVRARRKYLQQNHQVHWRRMTGVCEAFGISSDDDRYDLSSLPYLMEIPMHPFGCSVVYYPPQATEDGHCYFSRNYDFPTIPMAALMGAQLPPEELGKLPAPTSEPYVMEWYPDDGGYASIAIQAFDMMAGTMDGMNSAGLVVSIVADEEAIAEMGNALEYHPGPQQAVGIHELGVMRMLLDTCADVEEAKETLLSVKQYYRFVPCQYIVGDRSGRSFVYANSTGRNSQHVTEGSGRPQIVTNFQLYRHPATAQMPDRALSAQNNAFWRYRRMESQIAEHVNGLAPAHIKDISASVNIQRVLDALGGDAAKQGVAALKTARTIWHSCYDLQSRTMEVSFHLGDEAPRDGRRHERRSKYLKFGLETN